MSDVYDHTHQEEHVGNPFWMLARFSLHLYFPGSKALLCRNRKDPEPNGLSRIPVDPWTGWHTFHRDRRSKYRLLDPDSSNRVPTFWKLQSHWNTVIKSCCHPIYLGVLCLWSSKGARNLAAGKILASPLDRPFMLTAVLLHRCLTSCPCMECCSHTAAIRSLSPSMGTVTSWPRPRHCARWKKGPHMR